MADTVKKLMKRISLSTEIKQKCFVCIMNQQMHKWSTIYYTALYYIVPTCFNAIVSSSGSSQSEPAKLHKYLNTVLVIHFKNAFKYLCNSAGSDYKLPEDDAIGSKHVWAV